MSSRPSIISGRSQSGINDVANSRLTLAQVAGLVSGVASAIALLANYLFSTFATRHDLAPIEVKLSEMDRRIEQRASFIDSQVAEIKQKLDRVLTSGDVWKNAKYK